MKRLKKNEIDILIQDLHDHKIEKVALEIFMEKEIYTILEWILISSKNNKSFQFLYEICPLEVFKTGLKENDYEILEDFFGGRSAEEGAGLLTKENRKLDCERLKFLIKIDLVGVEEFMQKRKNEWIMKKSIFEDWEICRKEIENE